MSDDLSMNQKYLIDLPFQWVDSNRDKSKILQLGLKTAVEVADSVSLLSGYEKALQAYDDSIHSREIKRISTHCN